MRSAPPRFTSLRRVATIAVALLAVSLTGCNSSPEPPDQEYPAGVRIAAVGDMNGVRTQAPDSPSGRNGAAITRLAQDNEIDAFLGLGDFQYSSPHCADYVNYWKPLWGGTLPKLYWVSGPNHDWEPGRNEDLDNFMNGQCPGSAEKAAINQQRGFIGNGQPYSKDFGNWHFAFLPSADWRYNRNQAKLATAWLDNDLATATATGKHLAVVYHEPYFTSDTAEHSRAVEHKPWIDVMWKHRVRLTLSGSQHNYERSCPVNNADQCVGDGMTAFQVSTGGIGLRPFTSSPSYIEKRFSDTHGFLRLTLHSDGSFDWNFMPTTGSSTDSGTRPAPQ
jgi:acid phosphatase type 7